MLVCLSALSAGIFPCLCLRTFCVNCCSRTIICSHLFHEQCRSSIQNTDTQPPRGITPKQLSVSFGLAASVLSNPGSSSKKSRSRYLLFRHLKLAYSFPPFSPFALTWIRETQIQLRNGPNIYHCCCNSWHFCDWFRGYGKLFGSYEFLEAC